MGCYAAFGRRSLHSMREPGPPGRASFYRAGPKQQRPVAALGYLGYIFLLLVFSRHALVLFGGAHGVRGRHGPIRASSLKCDLAAGKTLAHSQGAAAPICIPKAQAPKCWTPARAYNPFLLPAGHRFATPRHRAALGQRDQPLLETRRAARRRAAPRFWSAAPAAPPPHPINHGLRRELLLLFNNFQPERQTIANRVRLDRCRGRQDVDRHQGQERRGPDHGQEDPKQAGRCPTSDEAREGVAVRGCDLGVPSCCGVFTSFKRLVSISR